METIQPVAKNSPSPEAGNYYKSRILAGLIAIPAIMLVLQILRTNSQDPTNMWICGFMSIPATMACLSTWYAFKGHKAFSRARMNCALMGGLIIGGIAFLVGFVGPLIFTPESNLGPILGIIVTGPIGFLVGNVVGAIYGLLRTHKQKVPAMGAA